MTNDSNEIFMTAAYEQATLAAARDEVPVGAVIVQNGVVIAQAGNRVEEFKNPTAHAELLAIEIACKNLQQKRLVDCDMYVTLEPCTQCAASISLARIKNLYIGALDEKGGGVYHGARFYEQKTCHHKPQHQHGIMQSECSQILKDFFQKKR